MKIKKELRMSDLDIKVINTITGEGCECCPFSGGGDKLLLAKDCTTTCCCNGDEQWESTGGGWFTIEKKNELQCAAVVEDTCKCGNIHVVFRDANTVKGKCDALWYL